MAEHRTSRCSHCQIMDIVCDGNLPCSQCGIRNPCLYGDYDNMSDLGMHHDLMGHFPGTVILGAPHSGSDPSRGIPVTEADRQRQPFQTRLAYARLIYIALKEVQKKHLDVENDLIRQFPELHTARLRQQQIALNRLLENIRLHVNYVRVLSTRPSEVEVLDDQISHIKNSCRDCLRRIQKEDLPALLGWDHSELYKKVDELAKALRGLKIPLLQMDPESGSNHLLPAADEPKLNHGSPLPESHQDIPRSEKCFGQAYRPGKTSPGAGEEDQTFMTDSERNNKPPHEQRWHPDGLSEIQTNHNTDSGYASARQDKSQHASSAHNPSVQVEDGGHDIGRSDDADTVYSDTSSTPDSTAETYLCELADSIFKKAQSGQKDTLAMEKISSILPELLKAFALKVGHNAPSQMHRDIMVFIHKNCREIAERFERMRSQDRILYSTGASQPPQMTLDQIMTRWRQGLDQTQEGLAPFDELEERYPPELDPSSQFVGNNGSEAEGPSFAVSERDNEKHGDHLLSAYRDFIFKSPAYEWMLETIQRECLLSSTEPNCFEAVRRKLMSSLPSSHRVSKRRSAEAYMVTFTLEWDPLAFILEQRYDLRPDEALERVITLTGTDRDAQAATCRQYLLQTWGSAGECLLDLVKRVICGSPNTKKVCIAPDGTRISGWFREADFMIEAVGTGRSVAEVGEQLAWLGAAVRLSTYDDALTLCTPFIGHLHTGDLFYTMPGVQCWPVICRIDFGIEVLDHGSGVLSGQCWHRMFRNPVLVRGYPIPRRTEDNKGLEIPLNMMAGLTQARRVSIFDGKVCIKGFSAMLVPTKLSGALLIWHLLYDSDGDRISYLENPIPQPEAIDIFNFQRSRHIVGWCSEARTYVGAADAKYNIGRSGLPRPPVGSATGRVSIYAGSIVREGHDFAIGRKDTPRHISRHGGYILKLRWIAKRFVVLWDECSRRGWLVNGTGALLHLARASLQSDRTGEMKDVFLLEPKEIVEASNPYRANSALQVLLNEHNRKLPLFEEGQGFLRFEDRVENIYNVLEQMIDYQTGVIDEEVSQPSDQLKGWDFKDLATEQDPFHLRLTKIDNSCRGWVDLTRDIHAVTLFGGGFGEIIQPVVHTNTYWDRIDSPWTALHQGMDYLAACCSDIKRIVDMHGNENATPVKLSDNVMWHNPLNPIEEPYSLEGSYDPVQVLLPSTYPVEVLATNPVPWVDHGAIIFGDNVNFKHCWKDPSDIEGSKSLLAFDGSDAQFHDSGISPSFSSSGATKSEKSAGSDNPIFERREYRVGIVCALPKELLAVRASFDAKHQMVEVPYQDTNHYAYGRMGEHNVVAACLPLGAYGNNSAADVVSHMVRSFPIRFCLLVGIGGGVPSRNRDIRLGDIVVSQEGVVQYDFGKVLPGGAFEATGCLQRPPRFLMTAIASLEGDPDSSPIALQRYIDEIGKRRPEYKRPEGGHDRLFHFQHVHHPTHDTCDECEGALVVRKARQYGHPLVHYGLIASGNRVMKDAQMRDQLGASKNFLCFEMEAAGIMDTVPCLVIRGICDYADSHKNDVWQEYASAAAAAYAKLLLSVVRCTSDTNSPTNGSTLFPKRTAPISPGSTSPPRKRLRKGKSSISNY